MQALGGWSPPGGPNSHSNSRTTSVTLGLSCPSSTYGGNQAISQQKPSLNNELSKGNFKHHMKHFLDGQKFWYPVNSVRYSPKWTSLVAHTVESTFNVGDLGSISGLGRSSGGGHGNLTPVFLPGESPWTKEPGRSKRAGHNWAAKRARAHTHTHTHTHTFTKIETKRSFSYIHIFLVLYFVQLWWYPKGDDIF